MLSTIKVFNVLLAFPIGTATVKRSFSQMKLIKTHLRNRISDVNLAELRKIEVEGPELKPVEFQQVLGIFKETIK